MERKSAVPQQVLPLRRANDEQVEGVIDQVDAHRMKPRSAIRSNRRQERQARPELKETPATQLRDLRRRNHEI